MLTRRQADLTAAVALVIVTLVAVVGYYAYETVPTAMRVAGIIALIILPPLITMTTPRWTLPFWIAAMIAYAKLWFAVAANLPEPASIDTETSMWLWRFFNGIFVVGRLIVLFFSVGLDGFGTNLGYLSEDES